MVHFLPEKAMKDMRKFTLMLILCLFSGSALAGKWVIGGSLATAKSNANDTLLNSQLAARGLNASASTESSIRLPWQLYAGYDFTEQWGAELSYLDLDKVKTTFIGAAVDIDTFLNSVQDIHPQTAQGWLVSLLHYIPIDYSTRVKTRIGLYNWGADYILQGGSVTKSVSQNGTDISYGLGLELGAWNRRGFIGHLKWDFYNIGKEDVRVIAFGFSYRFE
jgi:hypothetical protein